MLSLGSEAVSFTWTCVPCGAAKSFPTHFTLCHVTKAPQAIDIIVLKMKDFLGILRFGLMVDALQMTVSSMVEQNLFILVCLP